MSDLLRFEIVMLTILIYIFFAPKRVYLRPDWFMRHADRDCPGCLNSKEHDE